MRNFRVLESLRFFAALIIVIGHLFFYVQSKKFSISFNW